MRLVIFTHENFESTNEVRHGRDLYYGTFSSETLFQGPLIFNQPEGHASGFHSNVSTPGLSLSSRLEHSMFLQHLQIGLLQGTLNAHTYAELITFPLKSSRPFSNILQLMNGITTYLNKTSIFQYLVISFFFVQT